MSDVEGIEREKRLVLKKNYFATPARKSLCGSMNMHCNLYLKSRRIASADVLAVQSSSSCSLSLPAQVAKNKP